MAHEDGAVDDSADGAAVNIADMVQEERTLSRRQSVGNRSAASEGTTKQRRNRR